MYESFYGFTQKPFSLLPDPRFLYGSRTHRMALTMLQYGLHEQAGFVVLTGEVGTGKTTLLRHLLQIVQDEVDEIQVNVVKAATYTPGDLGRIESGLRSFLGDGTRIRFRFVETIEPGRNGKVQFVVSRPGRLAAHQEPAGRA